MMCMLVTESGLDSPTDEDQPGTSGVSSLAL